MKSNIKRINYDGTPNPNGNWWCWHEVCDICGADCNKDDWQTMTEPDTTEKDYCYNCLKQLIDERHKNS